MKSPVTIGPPEENEAPFAWKWRRLTDVARLESGHTPRKTTPEYWDGGNVPWISLQDIRAANGKTISQTKLMPTKLGIENSSARLLPQGTVVFSRDISVGYVAIMGREMSTTQHFANWICGDELNNHFLMYALMTSRRSLVASGQGSTVGTIYMPALKEFHLLVPPIVVQRKIVAKLETLLGKVDASQQRLEKIPVLLKRFRQSVLAAACSGRLTADWREENPTDETVDSTVEAIRHRRDAEARTAAQKEKLREMFSVSEENDSSELPANWRFVALNKLCSSFDYGSSAKSQPSGRIPVLRMGNIQGSKIDWMDLVYTSDASEIKSYALKPNTVLFNRTNSPELVGKTAIYRGEQPAIFAGYLIRINPFSELDPQYLNLCLNTNYAKEFCLRVRTDGVSQSNINAQKLGAFELPFCPLPEQQEIVRRVEGLFALADQLEARFTKARAYVDKLTPSLLARAFSGRLVPQDPTDEPAGKLLDRIKRSPRQ